MIRRARIEDARALAEVHALTWEEAYRGLVPDEIIDRRDVDERELRWREILGGKSYVTHAAEIDGVVVGFVNVGPTRETDRPLWGELYAIYLRAAHWGSGIASELMAAGEQELRDLGYPQATLWVLRDNLRARRFYEKHGWRLDGSEKEYVPGVAEVRYEREL